MTTLDKSDIELLREYLLKTWPSAAKANALCDLALDALSSLPAQAVGVKALEWRDDENSSTALEPFGSWYFVNEVVGHGWRIHYGAKDFYPSRDEAKAAAQADYETRILSALVAPSQPAAVGVTDEMVERAEAAVYPRHERGFLSKPLIDAIDMRKAIEAALRSTP